MNHQSRAYAMQGKVKDELVQKTIQCKGHNEGVETLKASGLLSWKPVDMDHQKNVRVITFRNWAGQAPCPSGHIRKT